MKRIILILICILLVACTNKPGKEKKEIMPSNLRTINIIIDNINYDLKLEDNTTASELISMLPLSFTMDELNGNEKYVYLDKSLSTNSVNPGKIEKGDVMLFGDNCLVIFYESFNTNYSYTKIGHINNLGDLGTGSVNVEIKEEK